MSKHQRYKRPYVDKTPETVLSNTVAYYLNDIKKYQRINQGEEQEIAGRIALNIKKLIDETLEHLRTMTYILDEWKKIKADEKSVAKLAEDYSVTGKTKEVSNRINTNLSLAEELFDAATGSFLSVKRAFKKAGISQKLYIKAAEDLINRDVPEAEYLRTLLNQIHADRETLILANLRLVISFAKRFYNLKMGTFADLIQEGNIGLMRAIEKFDPGKNIKFSTYASWWIKQAFIRAHTKGSRIVRLPSHICGLINNIKKIHTELGSETPLSVLAKKIGIPKDKIEILLSLDAPIVSMDLRIKSRFTKQSKTIGDLIHSQEHIENNTDRTMLKVTMLKEVKRILTAREAKIIILRYGLNDHRPHTLEEIAEIISKSRERVRQIEAAAIEKIRKNSSVLLQYQQETSGEVNV